MARASTNSNLLRIDAVINAVAATFSASVTVQKINGENSILQKPRIEDSTDASDMKLMMLQEGTSIVDAQAT